MPAVNSGVLDIRGRCQPGRRHGAPAARGHGEGVSKRGDGMKNEFTAIIEQDGKWFIAYCPEIPGANGQGETKSECLANLREAILLILEDRRQDASRGLPPNAVCESLAIG